MEGFRHHTKPIVSCHLAVISTGLLDRWKGMKGNHSSCCHAIGVTQYISDLIGLQPNNFHHDFQTNTLHKKAPHFVKGMFPPHQHPISFPLAPPVWHLGARIMGKMLRAPWDGTLNQPHIHLFFGWYFLASPIPLGPPT